MRLSPIAPVEYIFRPVSSQWPPSRRAVVAGRAAQFRLDAQDVDQGRARGRLGEQVAVDGGRPGGRAGLGGVDEQRHGRHQGHGRVPG
ncbi:hypothetical protein, partial [Streptomyces antimycoticus]|uniref:hypothetical protein n=1 Tax=Streptomyces antimycoticus TaxID=68175 RepID=UPI001F3D015B